MEAKLEAELQLLKLTRGRTKSVVEKGNIEKITRHKETLGKIVASIEDLKLDIEKGKLEAELLNGEKLSSKRLMM